MFRKISPLGSVAIIFFSILLLFPIFYFTSHHSSNADTIKQSSPTVVQKSPDQINKNSVQLQLLPQGNETQEFANLIPSQLLTSFVQQMYPQEDPPQVLIKDIPEINAFATYINGQPVIVLTERTIRFILSSAAWGAYTWSIALNPPNDSRRPSPLPTREADETLFDYHKRVDRNLEEWQNYLSQKNDAEKTNEKTWGQEMSKRRKNKAIYFAYLGFAQAFHKNEVATLRPPPIDPTEQDTYNTLYSKLVTGELAFVIGHEMGHFIDGDLRYAALSLNLNPSQLSNVNMDALLGKLVTLQKQRDMETNADNVAVKFVEKAGENDDGIIKSFWAKAGMEEFIHLMENQEEFESLTNGNAPEFLQDHPYWANRWMNICSQAGYWWFTLEGMRPSSCEDVQSKQSAEFREIISNR